MRDSIQFTAHFAIKALGVWLVRDELNCARHGACTIERALRTSERLNARHVVHMNIQRTLNGRDGLFIQIHADGRLRGGVIGVFARGNCAEENLRKAGGRCLDCHRRQIFHIIRKFLNLKLVQLFRANGLDRHGNILEAFFPLLSGDDDFIIRVFGRILRKGNGRNQHGRSKKRRNHDAPSLGVQHICSPLKNSP